MARRGMVSTKSAAQSPSSHLPVRNVRAAHVRLWWIFSRKSHSIRWPGKNNITKFAYFCISLVKIAYSSQPHKRMQLKQSYFNLFLLRQQEFHERSVGRKSHSFIINYITHLAEFHACLIYLSIFIMENMPILWYYSICTICYANDSELKDLWTFYTREMYIRRDFVNYVSICDSIQIAII